MTMTKEKPQEMELKWRGVPLELKDTGNGNKELYAKDAAGNSMSVVPVKTGIDVIKSYAVTALERGFRSVSENEITLGFLTSTLHCDFDGKPKSVEFIFFKDKNSKIPLKAFVDFEKETNNQISKLPAASEKFLEENGLRDKGELELKSSYSLFDSDQHINYFGEIGSHHQHVNLKLSFLGEPVLTVAEYVEGTFRGDSYGDIHSVTLTNTYLGKKGFSSTCLDVIFVNQAGKPEVLLSEDARVSDGEEVRRIINHPKAAEFKEIVERNRELAKIKPNDIIQSSGGS